MIATNEPTMPSFCKCSTYDFHFDSDGSIPKYHYDLHASCFGAPMTLTMKGEAPDPKNPGSLMEMFAVFNHTVAKLVPHMVYDVQKLPDGNIVVFTYACVGSLPLVGNAFSYNVIVKKPTLSIADVQSMIAKQNERTNGVLNGKGLRFADA